MSCLRTATAHADRRLEMSTLGFVRDALLLVIALAWCGAMYRRWRRDLETLLDSRQVKDWAVISALWGVTAVMLVCVISTSVGLIRSITHA